ncbi:MAG: hypothetical protein WC606_05330 [Candidatus Absconditabacterales bacterium]
MALFTQLLHEGLQKHIEELTKDHLLLAIIHQAMHRAWWSDSPNHATGLRKGEFFLSKEEYKKFGLKKSQANQICRKLDRIQELKIIEKVGISTGNKNAAIYKLLPNELFIVPWMAGSKTGNTASGTGNRIGTNKYSNKESENIYRLIDRMRIVSAEVGLPFNTENREGYAERLLSDQFYSDVIEPLQKRSKSAYERWEWILKIYKLAMTHPENKFRRGKVSDFKTLYNGLPKMAGLVLPPNI